MRACAACCRELPREGFSKKQWQMRRYRRCKECIANDRPIQLEAAPAVEPAQEEVSEVSSLPSPPAGDESASCWICLEAGGESGERLRRDCSCRGDDAGFAHLSCLVDYATHETENWHGNWDRDGILKFRRAWEECPHCRQEYRGALSIELAGEFVSLFALEKYRRNPSKLLEAIFLTVHVLVQERQLEIAKEKGRELLAWIERWKTEASSVPRRTLEVESTMYYQMGHIALAEGTEESSRAAVQYFEKHRDLFDRFDWVKEADRAVSSLMVETNIAKAKLGYEEGSGENDELKVEHARTDYAIYGTMHGEGSPYAVEAGFKLTDLLLETKQVEEAEGILAKLATTCKRVHGPDHELTKYAERSLEKCK